MEGQVVLRLRGALALATATALMRLLAAPAARADNVDDDDLHRPHRLTVGVADDLLGQLASDGKTLYFVSNRDTTNQIFVQDLNDGHEKQLFDDGADVTWPRVSPDGRSLLYISFRESASGQLCVRQLPAGDHRTCLSGDAAALQAEWIDSQRIALVSRQSTHADLRVLEVTTGSSLSSRVLLERNMTSPAVSPDGRWLVYVPVTRTATSVGPAFAAHAAPTLEVSPLGANAATATPAKIALQLPGQTGQPTFARDGRSLYVVQFFTDTNKDGTVDASDHGVLFRVPLSFASGAPVAGPPEQLTETSWNCEYPAPAADRLIATCSQDASLDLYSLPLDGEVPADWSMETLVNAIDDADTRVQEQLLTSRRLTRETTRETEPGGRRHSLLALSLVHLEREEFIAAHYYADQLDQLGDAAVDGLELPLMMLIEQRQAERKQEQGRLMEGFVKEARVRLDKLDEKVTKLKEGSIAEDLAHLTRSEIFDVTGDKKRARSELEAVSVDATTPAPIVEAYYQHADAFYRQMDDREALIALGRKLTASPGLRPDEKLHYAEATARAMVRGLPYAEADARLVHERAAANDPELTFAIDLKRAVLAIRDDKAPPAVAQTLLNLYGTQTRAGRRRALIVDAVQRADDVDADDVLDALVQRDIQDVKRGTHERGEVEDVYERLILARAYEHSAAKEWKEARDDFRKVTEQTGSYEAVVGTIDMGRLLKEQPGAIEAEFRKPGVPAARASFARAYLLARQLPTLQGDEHAKAAATALRALDASWSELKEERTGQALLGALLHEEFLQTGELDTAERANTHYLIALELMGGNPRFRAMILGELGLLHTDVGNYRIALGYLLERDKLPYSDDSEGLDVLLSKAQALLHVGREVEAATAGDAALAMIARNPRLSGYQILALDWAAVDHLAAGHFSQALALYDREVPLLDAEQGALAERNRVVVRVSRAAAAIGANKPDRALADLDYVDRRLAGAGTLAALHWAHATDEHVERAYRLITSGLRAGAERELGHLDTEAKSIQTRRSILEEKRSETDRAEIAREQMLAEAQLAINAGQRHDVAAARDWLGKAIARSDDLRVRGGRDGTNVTTPIERAELDVLWLAAELTVALGAPLLPDLPKRLETTSAQLAARHDPALRSYASWFEIYGPLVKR